MQSTEVIEVIVPEPPMGCSLALSDRGALCTVEAVQPASRAARLQYLDIIRLEAGRERREPAQWDELRVWDPGDG